MGAHAIVEAIGWIARIFSFLSSSRRQSSKASAEKLEDEILNFMAENGDWTSPHYLWATLYLGEILRDVPFAIAFPAPDLKGWPKVKWRIRSFGIDVRHRWRKSFNLVPERRVVETMRGLWKQGLLQRAAFDGEFYKLRSTPV
jgi:hypothetical protein